MVIDSHKSVSQGIVTNMPSQAANFQAATIPPAAAGIMRYLRLLEGAIFFGRTPCSWSSPAATREDLLSKTNFPIDELLIDARHGSEIVSAATVLGLPSSF
jgi:hypothetical protein